MRAYQKDDLIRYTVPGSQEERTGKIVDFTEVTRLEMPMVVDYDGERYPVHPDDVRAIYDGDKHDY